MTIDDTDDTFDLATVTINCGRDTFLVMEVGEPRLLTVVWSLTRALEIQPLSQQVLFRGLVTVG